MRYDPALVSHEHLDTEPEGRRQHAMDWLSELSESALIDLEILPVLVNLVLVLLLGQLLCMHYMRFAEVLSNKRKFAPILLFIAATTMLVISVVKTSLALSLGLVGALSIIRFRTPIMEPEELAYLFLSVAIGIGLGADQRLATTLMFVAILGAMALKSRSAAQASTARTLVHVNANLSGSEGEQRNADSALQLLLERVGNDAHKVDLRRVDAQGDVFDASLILDVPSASIGSMVQGIQQDFPGASVSVVESGSVD